MPEYQDGFGDEPTQSELIEALADPFATKVEEALTETKKIEAVDVKAAYDALVERRRVVDERTPMTPEAKQALEDLRQRNLNRARSAGAARRPSIDPGLVNKGGAHGPIVGMMEIAEDPLLVIEPGTGVNRAYLNIEAIVNALIQRGWSRHASIIDRWVAPNGIAIEFGYTHGEVWVRALWGSRFTRGEIARRPLWTWRIHEWGTEAATEKREELFRDLEALARSSRPQTMPERQGGQALGFVLLTPEARLPERTYAGDAGFDLYVAEETAVHPGEFVDIPLGVSVGFPAGVWGRITGRSSTLRSTGLLVNEGIIDNGYNGPLFAGVRNLTDKTVFVEEGDRIAQLILHDNVSARFEAVAVDGHEESADGRGLAGFGSSGR